MGYTGSEKCQRGLRLLIFRFFPRLHLFHGLRLLNLKKFPMPTFIKGPTFIRYLRVYIAGIFTECREFGHHP